MQTLMNESTQHYTDILIIGSGVAGLSAALRLAPFHQVTILSKSSLSEGHHIMHKVVLPPFLMTLTASNPM